MLLRTVASMGLICVLLGYAPLCQAQVHQFKPIRPPMQPAPKPLTLTDPREALRRPTPVAVLTSPDPQRLLTRLQEIVRSENFTILNTNARSGEFEASRKGDATSEKILVWLERDFLEPRRTFSIHMVYVRSNSIFGTTSGERLASTVPGESMQGLLGKLASEEKK